MRLLIAFLLPVSTFSFALGITQPLLVLEKLYFLEEKPNLIELIRRLWLEGDTELAALAVLVALFSVVFPAIKILLIHVAAITGGKGKSLALLSTMSKWSMLDVMLVALVIFAAKTSSLADAAVLPGLWFYALATFSTALAANLCYRFR